MMHLFQKGLLAISSFYGNGRPPFQAHTRYAVGLEFTPDYGVASIFFPNGTIVDVAKLEGGTAYRQMMRNPDTRYEEFPYVSTTKAQITPDDWPQAPVQVQVIRTKLPSWLGGLDSAQDPLYGMMKALKTALESYLDERLLSAMAVVTFPISSKFRKHTIATASGLSIRLFSTRYRQGGRQAWQAQEGQPTCDEDDISPAQLILTLEYSRAALTGLVIQQEACITQTVRVLHIMEDMPQDKLEDALRNVTNLPLQFEGNPISEIKYFSDAILLGEAANDFTLHRLLKKILKEQYEALIVNPQPRLTGAHYKPPFPRYGFDPLYAASQGAAHDCWLRLKMIEDQGGPCQLPYHLRHHCAEELADDWREDDEVD